MTILSGIVAGLLVVALVGLGVGYLGSDLWAVCAGQDEAVAPDQTLPVDAPTVSLVRSKEQEAEVAKAASSASDGVVLLNDWTYTQSTAQSPFIFSAPNGFDFFNPLFAFDFASPTTTQTNPFGFTPFGFNTLPNTLPTILISTSSGTVSVLPNPGTGTGGDTTTTTPVTLPNGSSVVVTTTISTVVFGVPIGTAAFSSRHGGAAIIVVVNVIIINVSPSR
jgi:hypothetical protein